MSSNQTENLNLHQWEKTDIFSRTEFNENFAKIDETCGALAESVADTRSQLLSVVTGSYHGNSGTQSITLGFRPKTVFIPTNSLFCGVASEGFSGRVILTDQGFQVSYSELDGYHINRSGTTYFYFVLK